MRYQRQSHAQVQRFEPYPTCYQRPQHPQPNVTVDDQQFSTLEKCTARDFFNNVLVNVPGKKTIFYESLRKCGLFHMNNRQIIDNDVFFEDPILGLENLWKFEGYIYVKQQQDDRICVYYIVNSSFAKLSRYECLKLMKNDYMIKDLLS